MTRWRVCAADGCPETVRSGYCPAHAPVRRTRSPSSKVTGTARWRKVKVRVLKRDTYVCHYCGGEATTADHRIPVAQGGAPFDEANLVASCVPCNLSKGARDAPRNRLRS